MLASGTCPGKHRASACSADARMYLEAAKVTENKVAFITGVARVSIIEPQ